MVKYLLIYFSRTYPVSLLQDVAETLSALETEEEKTDQSPRKSRRRTKKKVPEYLEEYNVGRFLN